MPRLLQSGIVVLLSLALMFLALTGPGARAGDVGQQPVPKGVSRDASGGFDDAIVYVRVPRSEGPLQFVDDTGKQEVIETPDLWDRLPDTSHMLHGFNAPGQLVLRHGDGTESVLFDCFQSKVPCVPLDPMVSPDGTEVIFAVYRAERLRHPRKLGATLPAAYLDPPLEAQLHRVDLASGRVTPLQHTPGTFDVSPAWLADGRILFASSRADTLRPLLDRIGGSGRAVLQLYTANADGSGAVNIAPHEVAGALHPYVLDSGRIIYSSQWLSHNLPYFKNNGSVNWPATLGNMWLVMDMDGAGGDMTALLGAHRMPFQAGGRTKTMKALHFLGQRNNGDICATNYYRGNNLGLGDILCWPPEPVGVEGELPNFLPRDLYTVANWSKSNDEGSFQKDGVFLGKIGYPEGLDDNQLLLSLGRGFCTQVSGSASGFLSRGLDRQPEKRACDVGVYRTTRIPSVDLEDLQPVVDRDNWHEFGARVVRARELARYPMRQTDDRSCQLASSNAGAAQTGPLRPYDFNENYLTAANNGSEIDGLVHVRELAAIRFWEVTPNRRGEMGFRNSPGHRLRLLGDVPLLADKSFKVQLPCDTPYLMAGIDGAGRVIKRDQVPQSLRPGEKRVCTGCHLHSKKGRPYEQSLAFGATAVPLLKSSPVPTYSGDIRPIFERRCLSCHVDDVPLMNYEKLVWDIFQVHVPAQTRVQLSDSKRSNKRYGLQRPYSSKYVNTMYARESLLYWKAVNERTDGRRDSTYADDIDFGADHPVMLTEEEITTLALWLDSGARR